MKILTLFRHAKSSWKHEIEDAYRPLNGRGLKDAPLMASQHDGPAPDRVLCSPAIRAYSTALVYLQHRQLSLEKLQLDWRLYEISGEKLQAYLLALPDELECLWVFGHNPGLNEFLQLCLSRQPHSLVTGAWVRLAFDCHHWAQIGDQEALLLASAKPAKSASA